MSLGLFNTFCFAYQTKYGSKCFGLEKELNSLGEIGCMDKNEDFFLATAKVSLQTINNNSNNTAQSFSNI